MTILQALNQYYERMAVQGIIEPPGYSRENISACIWLNKDGRVVKIDDLNEYNKKKPEPRRMAVPRAINRTSGVASNFLWDKTAYVLGVGLEKDKKTHRFFEKEHAAFQQLHQARLAGTQDGGLRALLAFLDQWKPEDFESVEGFSKDFLDKNMIFGFVDEEMAYLHDRPAAQALITAPAEVWKTGMCLVTGQEGPIERLHPVIKGVDGGQTSGARIVSYNADAFTSYGAEDGANAPTSVQAAFKYGTALNRLLDRASGKRMKLGDCSVVFWADATKYGEDAAKAAETYIDMLANPPDDEEENQKLREVMKPIREGRPLSVIHPDLHAQTRFYILGLSPNAARISVRYWLVDEFGHFAENLAKHFENIEIKPEPWGEKLPSLWRLLVKTTALMEKTENIPNQLAGEVARAVFSGQPYPRTLLQAAIIRLRAGDSPRWGWHAAIIKACINCIAKEEEKLPMSRQVDYPDVSYQLGRLFAILEAAQYAALEKVNASITDRFYGAASSTPARAFPALLRNARHHISDARKRKQVGWLEKRLDEIFTKLPPTLPKSLNLEGQGRFAVGYYHERAWRAPGQQDAPQIDPVTQETQKNGDAE